MERKVGKLSRLRRLLLERRTVLLLLRRGGIPTRGDSGGDACDDEFNVPLFVVFAEVPSTTLSSGLLLVAMVEAVKDSPLKDASLLGGCLL